MTRPFHPLLCYALCRLVPWYLDCGLTWHFNKCCVDARFIFSLNSLEHDKRDQWSNWFLWMILCILFKWLCIFLCWHNNNIIVYLLEFPHMPGHWTNILYVSFWWVGVYAITASWNLDLALMFLFLFVWLQLCIVKAAYLVTLIMHKFLCSSFPLLSP